VRRLAGSDRDHPVAVADTDLLAHLRDGRGQRVDGHDALLPGWASRTNGSSNSDGWPLRVTIQVGRPRVQIFWITLGWLFLPGINVFLFILSLVLMIPAMINTHR
jgi:hypothetical protein